MFRKSTTSQTRKETTFETIVRLAEENYRYELEKMIANGVCLDVREGEYRPSTLLAEQNKSDAVKLLTSLGASRRHAIKGYAIGGHDKQVNQLLAEGVNSEYAVMGYAMGGYKEEVNALIKKGASAASAAFGYAIRGSDAQVNVLLNADEYREDVLLGYAIGDHELEVDQLLRKAPDKNIAKDIAVEGYARGGHNMSVNLLLGRGARVENAMIGYAMGGYVTEVDRLLENYGLNKETRLRLQQTAASGYAYGGHVAQVDALLGKEKLVQNAAVNGYAKGGHVAQVNHLLKNGADPIEAFNGYKDGGYINSNALPVLVNLTENTRLKELLADEAARQEIPLDIQKTNSPGWFARLFSNSKEKWSLLDGDDNTHASGPSSRTRK